MIPQPPSLRPSPDGRGELTPEAQPRVCAWSRRFLPAQHARDFLDTLGLAQDTMLLRVLPPHATLFAHLPLCVSLRRYLRQVGHAHHLMALAELLEQRRRRSPPRARRYRCPLRRKSASAPPPLGWLRPGSPHRYATTHRRRQPWPSCALVTPIGSNLELHDFQPVLVALVQRQQGNGKPVRPAWPGSAWR